jgi:hypothetical protein
MVIKGLAAMIGTFVLSDVFKSKSQARIFTLNDTNLPKCTLANNSQKTKMVQIDYTLLLVRVLL